MSDEEIPLPTTVDELLERMETARAAFYASVAGLSEAELAAPLTERGWSVADHMAHIAVWMDGITKLLGRENRWAAMGASGPPAPGGDFDELNEQLRAPHRDKSPAEARAWLDAVHERMAATLRSLTIADLQRPYSYYQPDEQRADGDAAVLNWLAGDTYSHYDEHRGWIAAALNEERRS